MNNTRNKKLLTLVLAALFFALGNAIIVIPLGLVPSWSGSAVARP